MASETRKALDSLIARFLEKHGDALLEEAIIAVITRSEDGPGAVSEAVVPPVKVAVKPPDTPTDKSEVEPRSA
jgi:hypothetical protein